MRDTLLTPAMVRETPKVPSSSWSAAAAGESLFPRAERSRLPEGLIVAGYVTAFVALTSIVLLRQSGVPAWNTVWAEDGTVFYQQTFHHSFLGALTTTYAGYIQFFPRLVAEFARLFPLRDLAPVMALTGAATLSALALVVFHASRGHLRSPYARAVLVGAMVLLPVATGELLNNAVDAQWWFMFAAFWVLLWRPTTIPGKAVAVVTCFLAAASVPLVGLFVPVVALRTIVLRRPAEHAATAGWLAGLVLQGVVILRTHSQQSFTSHAVHGLPKAFALRVALGWVTGQRVTDYFISNAAAAGVALGVVFMIGVTVVALATGDLRIRMFSILTIALVLICFVVPVWLRGTDYASAADLVGGRYAATPILLLVSMLLVVTQAMAGERRGHGGVVAAALCLALLGPFWGLDFRHSNGRTQGPAWSAQVASATTRCADPAAASTALLQISPPGWTLAVPCSSVRG